MYVINFSTLPRLEAFADFMENVLDIRLYRHYMQLSFEKDISKCIEVDADFLDIFYQYVIVDDMTVSLNDLYDGTFKINYQANLAVDANDIPVLSMMLRHFGFQVEKCNMVCPVCHLSIKDKVVTFHATVEEPYKNELLPYLNSFVININNVFYLKTDYDEVINSLNKLQIGE